MAKYIPIPPRRSLEELTIFMAVNLTNKDDRFTIEASNENSAKAQLIYKLGYRVEHTVELNSYYLVEDEPKDPQDPRVVLLNSASLEAAYDEVLKAARWSVSEPITLLSKGDDDD